MTDSGAKRPFKLRRPPGRSVATSSLLRPKSEMACRTEAAVIFDPSLIVGTLLIWVEDARKRPASG